MFRKRSYKKELLDNDNIPFSDIVVNMHELDRINTLLGGHKITCEGVAHFLSPLKSKQQISIAEIGCGGGDNLKAIYNRFHKNHSLVLNGVDIKDECITYAKKKDSFSANWITSDYRNIAWPEGKPDIIFSSLFCHHFTDEQLVEQLKWLQQNSKEGFFINDLQRHPLAYYSIKILTALFSKSYLVKNDAPLSVLRGFKKKEWELLLNRAGISNYSIKWKWAFRYLVCVTNG